jgi:hypothetical protein
MFEKFSITFGIKLLELDENFLITKHNITD